MAFQNSPTVCSLPAYQTFMPLSGFAPALGYCSTTTFVNKKSKYNTANLQTTRDFQCPASNNNLCDLLSELKASDHEFARGVCCCIGICLGTQPTAFVTVSVTTSTLVTTNSSVSTSSATPSNASDVISSTVTDYASYSSTSSTTSSSSISSVSTAPSGPFFTSITSTSLLSSSSSSSSSSVSTSLGGSSTTSIFSSTSSISSSSTATCPSTLTTDPSCSTIVATGGVSATYTEYYNGRYFIESLNNPSNDNSAFPPIYNSMSGTLGMCDASAKCVNIADSASSDVTNVYYSFDLHYLASNATWECVLYYDPNTDTSYFSVADSDACLTFGYSASPS